MNVKKTFSVISAALLLCCGVFVGTAKAQSDDLWGDYNSSSTTEMSMPESDTPAGWEPLSELEEPATKDKPAKAAKPEKPQKAAKAPKPAKEAKPKAAPVGADDRNFNIFVNTGLGVGHGGYLVREMNTTPFNNNGTGTRINSDKDYYINTSEGLRFEAGAGYMAMPNLETRFSVDLNFGVLAPTINYSIPNGGNNVLIGRDSVKYSYWSWGIRVMAVPQFEVLELLDMYLGAGMSLLNFAYVTRDSTYIEAATSNSANLIYDMNFAPSVGFCGIVGFTLPFSEMMDFFGELQFESKSFTMTSQELRDNYKLLSQNSPTPNGKILYEKDKGTDRLAPPKYSGSSWGIRGGLRFWFAL